MNQAAIDSIGLALEHSGFTDDQIDAFLEHHGVKGQKWGVRRAAIRAARGPDRFGNRHQKSTQRRIDRLRRVASGTGSRTDRLIAGLTQIPLNDLLFEGGTQGGSAAQLDRAQRLQKKIKSGHKNVTDMMLRLGGVDVRELKYTYKQPKGPGKL